MASPLSVLLVDDEPAVGAASATYLERVHPGLTVTRVVHPDDALAAIEPGGTDAPDCVVVAIRRTAREPLALLETLRRDRPALPVVVFAPGGTATVDGSGMARLESAVEARTASELTALPNAIEYAVAERRVARAVESGDRTLRAAVDALEQPLFVVEADADADDRGGDGGDGGDVTGRLLTWNDAVAAVTGYDDGDLSTVTVEDLVVPADARLVREAVAEAATHGRSCARARLRREGGAIVPYEFAASRVVVDGERVGVCVIGTDVARRQEERQQLAVLHRVLRHNVRNSLNVVLGTAENVAREHPEVAADLDPIVEHARQLLDVAEEARVVSDVVDEGATGARSRDLVPVVERAVADVVPADLAVDLDLPASAPATLDDRVDAAVAKLLATVSGRVRDARLPDGGSRPGDGGSNVDETGHDGNGAPTGRTGDDRPTVSVSIETGCGGVLLSVQGGCPLTPSERRILERGVETPLSHGDDLRLWLVHWLVARSGGTVRVERVATETDRIVVEFPPGE